MRQLKTFMRNRKKEMLACGPCECRTLQCWRYANENCGCGEWGSNPEPTPQPTGLTLNITPSDQDTFIMDTMTWNQVTFPVNVVAGQQLVQNGTWVMLREWCDDPNIVGDIPGYIWIADYQLMKWEDNYPISCEWYINWEPWPTNEFEEDGEIFLEPQEILIEWDVNLRAEEVYDEGWE